ncbi:hypothetical protein BU26DRAFT_161886 [Trematosphaeria pertusa]|uniref:Uncharacterized protein n=1 Tax=Trematosphaeria pertusa TaxID=390896 RepID=A0A6A6HV80_9PLEO|nr:uncharacterized protein BU26DRAFT_161886 [Trematosphaeria pertusa]KAF2241921.1 hypothetical protein BU26DRAFT_161886 [Trematosphaeria pertusa]
MPSLFDLPQELQDEIISLVIHTPITLPRNIKRCRSCDYEAWPNGHHVFAPDAKAAYLPSALPLLLTISKLHNDTMGCLERKWPTLQLDVAIIDKTWVWPTWRSIPPKSDMPLEALHVNIVLACTEDSMGRERRWNALPRGKTLWGVILRFLAVGPIEEAGHDVSPAIIAASRNKRHPRHVAISTLYLDMDTSKCQTGNKTLSEEDIPIRAIDGMAHLTNDPLYPVDAESATNYMLKVLGSLHAGLLYGCESGLGPFVERVGKVVGRIDGHVVNRLNIGDYLMPGPDGDHTRPGFAWKAERSAVRRDYF